jgi:nucleotide-binding universal stress UspA family protein
VANPKTAPELLRVGARLAQARNGRLFILKVLPLAEQMPAHLKQRMAQREWESLSALGRQVGLKSDMVNPVVLLAPNPTAGILEAASDRRVDLLRLGWEGEHPPGDTPPDAILNPVIKRASCSVAILRGSVPEMVKRVLVTTSGGPYAPEALALGRDLAEPTSPEILVANMVEEHLTPELEAQARADVGKTIETAKNGIKPKERVVEVDNIQEGIIDQAKSSDLLLIGASRKGYPERPFSGGLATEIAAAAAPPTILTRGREAVRPWWQRLWETLTDWLSTLTVARQVEVYQSMRESAQPSIDFFVLITLAAVIASLGLLQNSGAVIIGAMLVAPLMSPILVMAMSMVHGNMRL